MKLKDPPLFIALALCAAAVVDIAAGYRTFSQAYDEPAHVACGMEWLDKGKYTLEPLHPPLARVAAAFGPYVAGLRSADVRMMHDARGDSYDLFAMGDTILNRGNYWRNLALARMGQIPFFVLGALVVFFWTRRLAGDVAAVLAVFCLVTLPPIVAFAGVAYTDLPVAVLMAASFFTFGEWLEKPGTRQTLLWAIATGLAVLCKLTALMFLPAGFLAIVLCRKLLKRAEKPSEVTLRAYLKAGIIAALVAMVVIWGGYRFSLQRLDEMYARPKQDIARLAKAPGALKYVAQRVIDLNPPVPAPAFFKGVTDDFRMNAVALPSYLLGRIRPGGWWYFFVVVLAVKTPIPFLLLSMIGVVSAVVLARRSGNWQIVAPAACVIALLLVTMPVKVNLGIRHVLAVYPLLAVLAGYGGSWLYERSKRQWRPWFLGVFIGLLAWQGASLFERGGDHLAYFNALAGSHPEHVALWGCDLDCGQDVGRLSKFLRERGVQQVSLALWTSADLTHSNLPPFQVLTPSDYPTGWVAASLEKVVTGDAFPARGDPHAFAWLRQYKPVALIGNTISVYYISPDRPADDHGVPQQRPTAFLRPSAAR